MNPQYDDFSDREYQAIQEEYVPVRRSSSVLWGLPLLVLLPLLAWAVLSGKLTNNTIMSGNPAGNDQQAYSLVSPTPQNQSGNTGDKGNHPLVIPGVGGGPNDPPTSYNLPQNAPSTGRGE
jgi:hypothetical protein